MAIKAYSSLSKKAIQEVLDLEQICITHDNLSGSIFLDSSLNYTSRIKCFFLLYENGELLSVLSMFIPTKYEAEITAYTLPRFRGKGYFKSLLAQAIRELEMFDIPDILFVCEGTSILGKQVIEGLRARYEHTEYFMRLVKTRYTPLKAYRLSLLKAREKDLEKAITTNMKVFNDSYEESRIMTKKCLQSEIREHYLGVLNEEIIGSGSVNLESEDVSIFGLGIVPEHRGKGYGKELLHLMIDSLFQKGRTEITIDVNSENAHALKLYKKSGFHIEVAYEYYRAKVNKVNTYYQMPF